MADPKASFIRREITMGALYIAQFEIVVGMNQWNDEQKGKYLLGTSLKGSALTVLRNLVTETRQDYRALVAALESRFGAAHQQVLHHTEFKSRLRCRELAEDIECLARIAYPLAPEDMKEMLAIKEQFIDAILKGDTRL